jgi:predicted dehydrogenase
MRALIVGLGSIGRRHLANLRLIDPNAHITVWDQESKLSECREFLSHKDRFVSRLEDALAAQPEVALITSPSPLHVGAGLELAKKGAHLFIEKPLSNSLDGVDELLDLCRNRRLVLLVGYNFRFYKPLQIVRQALQNERIGRVLSIRAEVGQYLPDWRPGGDYSQNVSAKSELGGGALLELSHELDYVRWFLGEIQTVNSQIGRLSDLDIDVEDTAEIILHFCNRAIGSVHLDMIQRVATRYCRIIGTEGTIIWDGSSHQVRLFSSITKAWTDLHPIQSVDRNDMYLREIRHFLDCVKGVSEPVISGEDGRRVLQIALAAKLSSIEQRVVRL